MVDKDVEEEEGNESIPPGTSLSPISNSNARPSKNLRFASIHQKTGFGITNTDAAILFSAREIVVFFARKSNWGWRVKNEMEGTYLSSGSITPAILCPSLPRRSPPLPPQRAPKTISPHPASSLHPSAPFHGITTLSGRAGMAVPLAVVVGICVCVLIGATLELGKPNEGGGTEAREERAPRSISDTRW
ncbi:hypothetical protein D1P53_003529 [Cryptococcus gattii VGV]|nr:hypothetical protein D1P53_003529 [Cryptococcus gattii VGV]